MKIETLQRRIGYGGKKGRSAARRVKKIGRNYSIDRDDCRKFFKHIKRNGELKPPS